MSGPLPLPGEPSSWRKILQELGEAFLFAATHPRLVALAAWAGLGIAGWCLGRHFTEPKMPSVISMAQAAAPSPASTPSVACIPHPGERP